jgi:hypothetical protein
MAIELKSHIELRGDNPLQARIAGKPWKVALVAKFILGWGIEHAVEHYGFSYATAHAVMTFYYDNQDAIEDGMKEADEKLSETATHIDERISKLRKKVQDS